MTAPDRVIKPTKNFLRGRGHPYMAFDLDGAAHAHEPGAELVLHPGIDAFGHVRKSKSLSSGSGTPTRLMRATSSAHSVFASCCERKLRSISGAWPSALLCRSMISAS